MKSAAEIPSLWMQDKMKSFDINPTSEFLHHRFLPYDKRIARAMLMDKHLMFIGDSLSRAMYKDMIALITDGRLNTPNELRTTNESSCHGDKQIDILRLEANRVFRQAREFQTNNHLIQFFFTSRAMRNDLEKTLLLMEDSDEKPDFVVMNSAIWDISRYHEVRQRRAELDLDDEIETIDEYLQRVAMVCRRMRVLLPPTSMFIFVLMPVTSKSLKNRGFLHSNQFEYQEVRMRMLEANMRAASVVREAGYDVLDLAYHFRSSSYDAFRVHDGVHWNQVATRFMNQLLLGHIAVAKGMEQAVEKRWRTRIKDTVTTSKRNPLLEGSLRFLKELNEEKQRNEKTQQIVRTNALDKIESLRLFPLCTSMANLRVLVTFINYNRNMKVSLEKIAGSFSSPEAMKDMFRFSKEDLCYIHREVLSTKKLWLQNSGTMAMFKMKRKLKRKHPEEEKEKEVFRPDRIQSPVPVHFPIQSPSQIPLPPQNLSSPNRVIIVPRRKKHLLPNPAGPPRDMRVPTYRKY